MRRVLVALVLALPLTACGLSGGPVSGQVLDEGTNEPIAGAIVVVKWTGDVPNFADSTRICYHVAATKTDATGRFLIPPWVAPREGGLQAPIVINQEHRVIAYKPGYAWSNKEPPSEEVELLAPFKGTVEERFKYFNSVIGNSSCARAGASRQALYWLWMALHEEANMIAVSADDKKQVDELKSLAQSRLVDESKPTKYDEHGILVNIDPRDNFKVEPLR